MTEPKGPERQRTKVLGDAPVSLNLKLPAVVHEALVKIAAAEYESVPTMIRRFVVAALRGEGAIE